MARRKLSERSTRKLTRTGRGGSISVTLPIELVRQLRWREKQKVVIKKRGSKLTIACFAVALAKAERLEKITSLQTGVYKDVI